MKTNQIVESVDRELEGRIVPQRTKDSFFALNPIISIINLQRLESGQPIVSFWHFLQNENVKEFVCELEKETGASVYHKATKSSQGWVHPFLAIKFLTHYNPKFEIQIYKWLFDYLMQNRISSCDSFNRMSGVLLKYAKNKTKFAQGMMGLSKKIRHYVGICESLSWNKATQEQLARRDELQNLIADLTESLGDNEQAIKLALKVYKDKYLKDSPKDLF